MTTAWQYLTLNWATTARRQQTEEGGGILGLAWEMTSEYTISGPDGSESRDGTVQLVELLNELGAAGWEIVASEITSSRVAEVLGWLEASSPVSWTFLFKRPVAGTL